MQDFNIFSHIEYRHVGRSFKDALRNQVNYGKYISNEIKIIDHCFNTLNSLDFYFGEYFNVFYLHHVSDFSKIIYDLYAIEKKSNPYLKLEKFKEMTFGPMLYEINNVFKNINSFQNYYGNCYYYMDHIDILDVKRKNIYIADDFFSEPDIILDYFSNILEFISTFNPNTELEMKESPSKQPAESIEPVFVRKPEENSTSNHLPPAEEELDFLTNKQIDKIGLLVRSGIISFLRDKNPEISNSNIAKFIREITSIPLESSESIRPHLTNDINNVKHPFYMAGRKDTLDLILSKFKITPQSEE